MTFETATVNIKGLVDVLANRMIALGQNWIDGDAGLTTASNPFARVIKYNVAGQELYVCFANTIYGYAGGNSSYGYNDGIIVFISSGWDAAQHIPAGTVKLMHIPVFQNYLGTSYDPTQYDANTLQYWLWFEDEMLVFGWQASATGHTDCVGMFAMEHNTAKEYADNGSNFFFYTTSQKSRYNHSASAGAWSAYGSTCYSWGLPAAWNNWKNSGSYPLHKYVHPFVADYPGAAFSESVTGDRGDNFGDGGYYGGGRSLCLIPAKARKSGGNSKVYMAFPVVYADADEAFQAPIATMKSFFPVDAGKGIADGDLINVPVIWEGAPAATWQYIYKCLVSPDGTQIDVAIKYAVV